jgi:hypothetical protein
MRDSAHNPQGSPARQTRPGVRTPFEILSLDHPSAVALSHASSHPVLWISSQPPQKVLGVLGKHIQGAWYEAPYIVVALNGQRFIHQAPPAPIADIHAVLRSVLVAHLNGSPVLPASGRQQTLDLDSFSA